MTEWLAAVPYLFMTGCALVFGLLVGSFLNVLVARLPYEKSITWPSSRCFVCFKPIGILDNVPILGYLRLRGKCRKCGVGFSSRYLWVEVFTGLLFAGVFVVEALLPMWVAPWGGPYPLAQRPGVQFAFWSPDAALLRGGVVAAVHCFFIACLLASALIDLKHKVIPVQITYTGTVVGLLCSVLLPWPWPNSIAGAIPMPPARWDIGPALVNGVALWPVWIPPTWAPAGSPLLGLLTGLAGAAAGMFVGRAIKGLYQFGRKTEALGLGDADLLMMAGAFLGWQPTVLALPVGAVLTLFLLAPIFVVAKLRGKPFDGAPPFGPGIAAGLLLCWFGWPWLGELVRVVFFDPLYLGFIGGFCGVGLLVFGFVLRGRGEGA